MSSQHFGCQIVTTILMTSQIRYYTNDVTTLSDYPVRQLRDRLRILYRVSDLVKSSWRLLPASVEVEKLWPSKDLVTLTSMKNESLRLMLWPQVYNLPLVQTLQKTMVQGRNYGPQVN